MIIPVLMKLIPEIKESQKVGQERSDHIIMPQVNTDTNGAEPADPDLSSREWQAAVEFSMSTTSEPDLV